MSTPTWGLDPKARRISVYFEGETTIYEGMPVCYNYDTTDNWLGVASVDFTTTASSVTESGTTAEGAQNEGKFIRVELPTNNNITSFAGVVAGADHAGETGPRAIDIYIPNGAIVPCRCDVDTTAGVTILGVTVASTELGQCVSGTSRPVGIAGETETGLDDTTGLTLVKLDPNMFVYQNLDGTHLEMGAGTSNLALNEIRVDSAQTTGTFCALYVRAKCSGGGYANANAGGGIAAFFRSEVTATPTQHTVGVHIHHRQSDGTASGYHFGQWIKISSHADATMTDCVCAPLALETLMSAADTANHQYYLYLKSNGTYKADGLFMAYNAASLSAVACTGDVTTTGDDLAIPININGVVYYLIAVDGIPGA